MQTRLIGKLVALVLLAFLVSTTTPGQRKTRTKPLEQERPDLDKQRTKPLEQERPDLDKVRKQTSAGFSISRVEGNPGLFNLLLTDGSGKSVTGFFTLQQLEVFESVLLAAKEFAQTDEKAGVGKPITTRLMEQHEWSLFVDVTKMGNQSRFYVSLITPGGRLTAEAGEIIRGSNHEPSALLLNILAQVQAARGSTKSQD